MTPKICQSCGMPLGEEKELHGTQADGTINPDYCIYCYRNGDFTADITMEEMINSCIPFMLQAHPELAPAKARAMMHAVLSQLKRWKKIIIVCCVFFQ